MVRFNTFSPKQLEALTWWLPSSPHASRDAIICDGAVRSGKTLCLTLSFSLWAMSCFDRQCFALCGKTLLSLRRNVLGPLLPILESQGFRCRLKASQNLLELTWRGRQNTFYLFGGRDEGSAALIQGVTLAGVLLDEVALMPRSFVEQGVARCSVEGSRFWFSCNPGHPGHWFYRQWIRGREQKNALYLHFTMEDNPALSPAILDRYQSMYAGVFHQRYVLGHWTAPEGLVYPMFSQADHVVASLPICHRHVISCDYGTVNPSSFGLWGEHNGVWYRLAEFYHDSRALGHSLTDEEYADALETLAGHRTVEAVVVDPSAASFIQCLRNRGRFRVVPAKNPVLDGIRLVAAALKDGKLRFHQDCGDTIREFGLYRWNLAAPTDTPVKEFDHAMDDIRYFAMYAFSHNGNPFHVQALPRR